MLAYIILLYTATNPSAVIGWNAVTCLVIFCDIHHQPSNKKWHSPPTVQQKWYSPPTVQQKWYSMTGTDGKRNMHALWYVMQISWPLQTSSNMHTLWLGHITDITFTCPNPISLKILNMKAAYNKTNIDFLLWWIRVICHTWKRRIHLASSVNTSFSGVTYNTYSPQQKSIFV